MKVTLQSDDGRDYDITEHFQVMYDQLVQSLDWGSGFLDANEALIVMQAGAAAGFEINISRDRKYTEDAASALVPTDVFTDPVPNVKYGDPRFRDQWDEWTGKLTQARTKWINENLGDPITWDSIAAYRQKLDEMENSE